MEKHLLEDQKAQHFQNTFTHKGNRAGALRDYESLKGNCRKIMYGHGYPKENLLRIMEGTHTLNGRSRNCIETIGCIDTLSSSY